MAACTLLMYVRPYLLGMVVNDKDRLNEEICLRTLGLGAMIQYTVTLVLVHHFAVCMLAAWSWAHIGFVLLETAVSGVVTILLIISYNILKYR